MNRQEIRIRKAVASDLESIVCFNQHLASETEGKELDCETLTLGVESVLGDPSKGTYFVATDHNDTMLGQVMITTEWSDWRNGMIWWLQSVYVDVPARRQGIFTALIYELTRQAEADPEVCAIRLYVERANHAARSTYETAGFHAAGYDVMERMFS